MSSEPPSVLERALATSDQATASKSIETLDPPSLIPFIQGDLPEWSIPLFAARLPAIFLTPTFTPSDLPPPARLAPLLTASLSLISDSARPRFESAIAEFVIARLPSDRSFLQILTHLDFSHFSLSSLLALLEIPNGPQLSALAIGEANFRLLDRVRRGLGSGTAKEGVIRLPVEPVTGPVRIDESALSPARSVIWPAPAYEVTDVSDLEVVRTFSYGCYGKTCLLRRPLDGEQFVAKYYSAPPKPRQFTPLFPVSHPAVLPIVGLIPPKRDAGPIVVTPYSEAGSLADVLEQVAEGNPPPFWNDTGKLRLIVTAVAGLRFLHSRGIVHRLLRPSQLIMEADGSVRIAGYVTALLEERGVVKPTMMHSPLYLAPEVYEVDKGDDRPPVDVFAFALLLCQLVFGQQLLTSDMSPAKIMRAVISEERPEVTGDGPDVLRGIVADGWKRLADDRPSFDDIWERLKDVGFRVFPDVEVDYVPEE